MALPKSKEEVNTSFDLSVQKPRKPHRVYTETRQSPKDAQAPKSLNLNEMVTLQIIKSSHETGVVKKMLHAPSLRLFAVKEVPLTTRESRNLLKQWVDQWQNEFGNSRYHLKIYTTYFNVPEGCLSIITELTNAGSLQSLTEAVGSLPEAAIKTVAKQLLKALNGIHTKLRVAHGVVCPSQILLEKNGDVKLSMGLADKIQPPQMTTGLQYNGISRNTFEKFNFLDKPSNTLPNFAQKGLLGQKSPKNSDDVQQQAMAQDIFDFGWLMLKSAVGDLELFGEADFSLKLKIFLDEYNKRPEERHNHCCVLHDEELIASINPAFPDYDSVKSRSKRTSRKEKFQLGFKDLLSANNFSENFLDFLCGCLRFNPDERLTASSLLSSSFIKSSKSQGPSTSLVELLKLNTQANKDVILPAQYQAASEKHLEKVCSALSMIWSQSSVISNEDADIRRLQYMNANSMAIQDLAFELGLPSAKVFKQLKGLIGEF